MDLNKLVDETHNITDQLQRKASERLNKEMQYYEGYIQACEDYGRRIRFEIMDAMNAGNEVVSDTNAGSKWIPVSERLPENETEVEISCIRRYIGAGDVKKESYFTARAFYSDGTLTTEDSSFTWDEIDNWEYNEEKDAYIIPEGWWEYVTFSEQFGVVDAEVIAWQPLPEPYREKVE